MAQNDHISEKMLEKYVLKHFIQSNLSEPPEEHVELKIEEHVANCDSCAEKANEIYKQLLALSEWNVFEDNQLLMKEKVIEALGTFAESEKQGSIRNRLRKWMNSFKGISGGSVKFLMNVSKGGKRKHSRFITEGLEFFNQENAFSFNYELSPITGRGTENLEQINMKEVYTSNEQLTIKAKLNNGEKKLTVELEGNRAAQPPVALLLSFENDFEPLFIKPEWQEQTKKLQIVINNIPEGEYSLLFEPKCDD